MKEPFIIELSETPMLPENYVKSQYLSQYFPKKNPFWTTEGDPFEIPYRGYVLKHLSTKLPHGYVINLKEESIDILAPDAYLQETIDRFKSIDTENATRNPLLWWKREVCLFEDILIYFRDEFFTLHEFLLYLISGSKGSGIKKLYVGSVFEYYDDYYD